MRYERITVNPRVMVGKPVIRGTRLPVEQVLRELAGGLSFADVLGAHPRLVVEDILSALTYAADVVANEDIYLNEPGDAISGG
jgi:uncharacterized protein (DUF433 family)